MGRSVPMMAAALSLHAAGPQQIVVLAGEGDGEVDALTRALALRYLPFATLIRLDPAQQSAVSDALPFVAAMRRAEGQTTVYVCRDFACRPPVTTVEGLDQELR
jgi:uncharacterized protein YyaL (SSP411 family)